MKKGLSFFLIVALLITTGLRFMKEAQISQGTDGEPRVVTSQTEEVDLNTFLGLYSDNTFEKVQLKDVVKLRGYEVTTQTGEAKTNFLGVPIDKEYTVYTTNKPPETSLVDLGFLLTGDTIIDVNYSESSVLTTLFLEHILPLVFLILLLVLAFRFF